MSLLERQTTAMGSLRARLEIFGVRTAAPLGFPQD